MGVLKVGATGCMHCVLIVTIPHSNPTVIHTLLASIYKLVAGVQGIDLRYTNEYEKVFVNRFLKCQILYPSIYRSLRDDGVVQLIYDLRRSRWNQPLRLVPYNIFKALVDQYECTINDISDNFEAMTAYLYTPEEAINGKALTPRVKECELLSWRPEANCHLVLRPSHKSLPRVNGRSNFFTSLIINRSLT